MVGRPKKSETQKSEDPISVTKSGRKIIRPGDSEPTTQQQPSNNSKNKKSNKSKDSDEEEEQQNIVQEKPLKKSAKKAAKKSNSTSKKNANEVSSSGDEVEEEVQENLPKVTKRKGKKAVASAEDSSSSSSSSYSGSNIATRKYTAQELAIIQSENRMVYLKFFFFSFLMVLVPIMSFKLVNGMIGDFLGINRVDRVAYAGFASLGGLVSVVAAYSIMAYYEK